MLFICNKLFPFKVHHDEIVHQSTFLSCRFNALMFNLHEVESKNILYYLRTARHFVDAVQNNSRLIQSREKMAGFFVTK